MTKVRTAVALGPLNIFRVGAYRMGLKLGLHPVQRLKVSRVPVGPFFKESVLGPLSVSAAPAWPDGHSLFGHLTMLSSDSPPDWHLSLASGKHANATSNWSQISDFDTDLGDIKPVWEVSRMAWLISFAQAARQGDAKSLQLMNAWLDDWLHCNPPYRGVNWKCGQEASLRILSLAVSAQVMGQLQSPSNALQQLVKLHLDRIAPTLAYAKAQDNNHGTSEAAALFVGGALLGRDGKDFVATGRAALEERIKRLVMRDGSFSQQSLVYHRLFLDTLSVAEMVRREFNLPGFSSDLMLRIKAAVEWLHALIDQSTGDGPNLGANDGAFLLPMSHAGYRDFRLSLQVASVLFSNARAIPAQGHWDDALAWLGISQASAALDQPKTRIADEGGFAVLRRNKAMALLRYPRFRFRPSQADVLHLDLWVDGRNVLSDAGTYSYNTDPDLMAYFSGTQSHNTVQFDQRNQMPKLSRFLFGDWLKSEQAGPLHETSKTSAFAAAYRDRLGARHHRAVELEQTQLKITDDISGFERSAILRWRVKAGPWSLTQNDKDITLASPDGTHLAIQTTMPVTRAEITTGWSSEHYLQKIETPVLEVEVRQAGQLVTRVTWQE
jgi:hypothetical protein